MKVTTTFFIIFVLCLGCPLKKKKKKKETGSANAPTQEELCEKDPETSWANGRCFSKTDDASLKAACRLDPDRDWSHGGCQVKADKLICDRDEDKLWIEGACQDHPGKMECDKDTARVWTNGECIAFVDKPGKCNSNKDKIWADGRCQDHPNKIKCDQDPEKKWLNGACVAKSLEEKKAACVKGVDKVWEESESSCVTNPEIAICKKKSGMTWSEGKCVDSAEKKDCREKKDHIFTDGKCTEKTAEQKCADSTSKVWIDSLKTCTDVVSCIYKSNRDTSFASCLEKTDFVKANPTKFEASCSADGDRNTHVNTHFSPKKCPEQIGSLFKKKTYIKLKSDYKESAVTYEAN